MQPTTMGHDLVRRVAMRLGIARSFRAAYWLFLMFSGVFGLSLLASRLLGIFPLPWSLGLASLAVVGVGSILGGLFWYRGETAGEAARQLDHTLGSHDLFLTTMALDRSAGAFQDLVLAESDRLAQGVDPRLIVPIRLERPLLHVALLLFGFLIGLYYLPQWDPFGGVAAAQERLLAQTRVTEERQATQMRMAIVTKDRESKSPSPAEKSVEDLLSKLKGMKPGEQAKNLEVLSKHQRNATEQWRAIAEKKLQTLLRQGDMSQDFGGERERKLREWTRDLAQGNDAKLQAELQSLENDIEELGQLAAKSKTDPTARAELEQKIKERLKNMEKLANEKIGSPELTAALKRAMRQMEAAQNGGDPQEMMQAMQESIELAKMELKQVARSAKELKDLEQALKVVQMAKQLNEKGELQGGEATSDVQSLEDYEEMYAQMMAENEAEGEGIGGEGSGRGGVSEEDDSVATNFKEEETKVAVQAGKTLMSLEGRGVSASGKTTTEYQELLGQVKQGVSEAIAREQVPPGYHEAIRRYFDGLGENGRSAEEVPSP